MVSRDASTEHVMVSVGDARDCRNSSSRISRLRKQKNGLDAATEPAVGRVVEVSTNRLCQEHNLHSATGERSIQLMSIYHGATLQREQPQTTVIRIYPRDLRLVVLISVQGEWAQQKISCWTVDDLLQ